MSSAPPTPSDLAPSVVVSHPQQPTPYPPNPSTYQRMSALGKLSGVPSRVRVAVALAVFAVAKCVAVDIDTVSCVALQNPSFDLDVLNGTHAPAYQYRCVSLPIPQPINSSFFQGCAHYMSCSRACVRVCVRVRVSHVCVHGCSSCELTVNSVHFMRSPRVTCMFPMFPVSSSCQGRTHMASAEQ
jgi:hypothetical protein